MTAFPSNLNFHFSMHRLLDISKTELKIAHTWDFLTALRIIFFMLPALTQASLTGVKYDTVKLTLFD